MSEQEEVSRPDEDIKETHLSETSSGSPDKTSRKQIEDKKMTEVNGEIGYYVKKGTQFIPMTNFSVTCIGYVTENSQNNCSEDHFTRRWRRRSTAEKVTESNIRKACLNGRHAQISDGSTWILLQI